MKGRKCIFSSELKKKLTVIPFMPGSPTVITYTLYKLDNNFIYIPKYFSSIGSLIENKIKYCKIKINGEPREYQKHVINTILNELKINDSCIACLYTGWGKTFAALYISALLGVKTIILVNKETLLEQWKEQIIKFLGITPGIIRGKIIDTDPDICIGMIQSISMKEYNSTTFDEFSFAIYDETHHYCSKVFSNVFYKIGAKYNLGLTATLKRSDKLEHTLNWFLGNTAVNVELLIIEPIISLHMYYDYPNDTIKYLPNGKVNSAASITNVTYNNNRDIFIINLISNSLLNGRKILVLSDRKAHCDKLVNLIKKDCSKYSVGLYYGGMKKEQLHVSNNCDVIVATYQMASEGYDNPKLDTLVLASPKCNIEQAIGRILRRKNENTPLVIDINDCISIFNRWNKTRLSFYKSKKFKVLIHENENENQNENENDILIKELLIRD